MSSIITFGEIMARLAPPGFLRLSQSLPGSLEATFAGAEANVAVSLALFGAKASFVSALPQNPLAEACVATLQGLGVGTQHIRSTEQGRLGLYFVETGANQRPSRVVYDREYSAISLTSAGDFPWETIFAGTDWFHVTGITPALSEMAAAATLDSVRKAKAAGLTVSCDLNFRGKLWRWEPGTSARALAQRTMHEILPFVDVLIANEEDCGDVLDIRAAGADLHSGQLDTSRYPDVARQVTSRFPNIQLVATTLRESVSASHNNWGAMLFAAEQDAAYFAPQQNDVYQPYEIRNIVDRVGGGDAFAAGLIFGLTCDAYPTSADALAFAVAASCLAHSISGDFNFSSRAEVDALAGGLRSGRVVR